MPLTSLEIQNVRMYGHAKLSPDPHLNLIVGANASGKTTLLEAIHLLSVGRSFRSSQIEQIQKHSSTGLSVQGEISGAGVESGTQIGFVHTEHGRRASVNGLIQNQMSALAQLLPLQAISPDTHYEFRHSARHRRGILDWGLFHVEPDFLALWNRYRRIIQQRNAALKGAAKARHAWDQDLAVTGEELQRRRKNLTAHLQADFQHCCQELLEAGYEGELIFESGWKEGEDLAECLRQDDLRDRARGFTHSGPHRADLRVGLRAHSVPVDASHGQYKLLVIALRLTQIRNFIGPGSRRCCLLIDDLAAELDSEHRARLARLLSRLPIQLFVTATENALIERGLWPSHKTFHVEQGAIEEGA
jgi:DNA replication and repair protein RecF